MKLHLFYSDVFSANVTEIARPAASRLREQMNEEENKAVELVESFIKHAAQYNRDPDLVYTCNEHYLSSLMADMMEADDLMSTDSGSTRHIYHNVRAFIKVQKKNISEIASKELQRIMVNETTRKFKELISARSLSELDLCDMVQEQPGVTARRTMLKEREQVLENALQIIRRK
jgi:hypothetical protein